METQRRQSTRKHSVLPHISVTLPPIGKKQTTVLTTNSSNSKGGRRLSIISTGLSMERSGTLTAKLAGKQRYSAAKKGVKEKDPEQCFTPRYDENEKPPAVRFIYSEAVRKTLKRCGVPMSRLARSKASAASPVDYMDNTDDSLELTCLEDISVGVLERIQMRQAHPSRYGRREEPTKPRLNSSMRSVASRASRLNRMRADTGVQRSRFPALSNTFDEEDEEGITEDIQAKIEALVGAKMLENLRGQKSAGEAIDAQKEKEEKPGENISLPPILSSRKVPQLVTEKSKTGSLVAVKS